MPPLIPRAARTAPAAVLLAALAVAPPGRAAAGEPTPEGVAFFEKNIRPVLAAQCYSCHAGNVQAKGGLRVDTRAGLLVGGTSGAAVVPGKPDDSPLVTRVHDGEMPPKAKLPPAAVADLRAWVAMGAPDPRAEAAKPAAAAKVYDFAAARKGWAYQPPKAAPAPAPAAGAGWAWSPVDHFVRAKQEAAGTAPGADADPVTWLRRVSFDLVGLPPTADQVAAIEKDSSRPARERVVDALLASPAFGERWGRHWLDVARYAESTGKERNYVYPQAWRYRDWVIDAFNADKPFDRFVREQVAGDLLPAGSSAERDAQVIATGFLALGPKGVNERNREQFLLDVADEQVENVSRAVLGLTVGCARCHDHKFDPIPTADYYALAGIFRSSETRAGIQNRQRNGGRNGGQPELLIALAAGGGKVPDPKLLAEIAAADKEWADKRDESVKLRDKAGAGVLAAGGEPDAAPASDPKADPKAAGKAKADAGGADADRVRAAQREVQRLAQKVDTLRNDLARQTAGALAAGVIDWADPQDIAVRNRGEADKLGPVAPRGFPQVVAVADPPRIAAGSGRKELADWLTRPDHPLTARVAVNRLWGKLFGVGIVPTVDDFGDQGQKPTHPELLDYLAVRFVEGGWSVKATLKELVLSRTYQLAADDNAADLARDEANVTLWRWNRKRLDAEALRDAALAAARRLDPARPAGSPVGELGTRELTANADFGPLDAPSRHRSVYLPVLRNRPPEALALFDLPDPSLVAGVRETTTGPNQALYLLNGPFALEQAGHVADWLLADPAADDAARVERAYLAALARRPTAGERDRVLQFLAGTGSDAAARRAAWAAVAQALLALPEFRYLF